MGSMRDIFGEFSPMNPWEHRTSNIQYPTANQWPNWKPLVVRCWMLGVGCFLRFRGSMREFFGEFSPHLMEERERLRVRRAVCICVHLWSRLLFPGSVIPEAVLNLERWRQL